MRTAAGSMVIVEVDEDVIKFKRRQGQHPQSESCVTESRRPAGTTRVVCHYDVWRISVVPDSPASLPPRARSMGEVVMRVRRERRDAASQHGLEFGASVPSLMPDAWFGDSSVGMVEVRHGRCGVARFSGCRGCAAQQFLGVRMTELCGSPPQMRTIRLEDRLGQVSCPRE
jgi:hypothetical protein